MSSLGVLPNAYHASVRQPRHEHQHTQFVLYGLYGGPVIYRHVSVMKFYSFDDATLRHP
jgi:hypothetical protein